MKTLDEKSETGKRVIADGGVNMNYKNGFFQLENKEDGTYIKLYPAMNDGKPIMIEDVAAYLHEKKIEEFDIRALNQAILNVREVTTVKVTDQKILSQNEYMKISVNKDRTKAVVRFYPPSSTGKLITKEEIMSDLAHKGIVHGIIEKNIDLYLSARKFCTNILIAKATEPIQGKNAEITYHFNTGLTMKPKINEDGTVDFHNLDNISRVNAGDLLATLQPADLGTPGTDVTGKEIHPVKVNILQLKHGKNIHLSEDKLKMYTDVSGHVNLVDDTVFVSNTYEVTADVCSATGDINYDGNVEIKGNVITGFKVEAKGDIIVHGVVEGATLIAGGQIVLFRGIQGMGRGILKAEGDIVTKFIENSEVYSNGNISTDAIMHSKVVAKGEITATGKRGLINGGEVKSELMISMKNAGSTMGTKTVLEVGIDSKLMEALKDLEKRLVEMSEEKEKNEQFLGVYKTKLERGDKIPEDRLKQIQLAKRNIQILDQGIAKAEEQCAKIREEIEKHSNGRIKVEKTVYPGVKVIISNVVCNIKEEIRRCQFVKDKAEIKKLLL